MEDRAFEMKQLFWRDQCLWDYFSLPLINIAYKVCFIFTFGFWVQNHLKVDPPHNLIKVLGHFYCFQVPNDDFTSKRNQSAFYHRLGPKESKSGTKMLKQVLKTHFSLPRAPFELSRFSFLNEFFYKSIFILASFWAKSDDILCYTSFVDHSAMHVVIISIILSL